MSDLLAAYTQRQICAIERDNAQPRPFVDSTGGLLPGTDDLGGIPRASRLRLSYFSALISSRSFYYSRNMFATPLLVLSNPSVFPHEQQSIPLSRSTLRDGKLRCSPPPLCFYSFRP